MNKPMIRIYTDAGIDDYIDREMNAAEFKQYETDQAETKAIKDAAEAKATAKSALLVKLGITEDEAKLLLG